MRPQTGSNDIWRMHIGVLAILEEEIGCVWKANICCFRSPGRGSILYQPTAGHICNGVVIYCLAVLRGWFSGIMQCFSGLLKHIYRSSILDIVDCAVLYALSVGI